ncbi:MAG: bacillithiol biosynthesis deacetylase BshB1 [Actinobacteria bacterium]|nr:bacillithiol biosynthesis deacetylase BshB1 [Actinomycetota bacterium]
MSQEIDTEKLDLLAFAAHPDDAELNAGGLIAKMTRLGYKVGIVDLTAGEMATRGSVASRREEAAHAAQILGLAVRENLGFPDGNLSAEDPQAKRKVVESIRRHRPAVVLAGLTVDYHPDHYRGGQLVSDAAWLAGRTRYDTAQEPHQVKRVLHYPEHFVKEVSFIVDISEDFDTKRRAVLAFASQFYQPDSAEPATYISSKDFMGFWQAQARYFGGLIGKTYGEPYFMHEPVEVPDPVSLWS